MILKIIAIIQSYKLQEDFFLWQMKILTFQKLIPSF